MPRKTGFVCLSAVIQSASIENSFGGIDLSSVTVELELPQDWKRFQMPVALKARLNSLLDESDKSGELNKAEREEAQALSVQAHPVPVVQADRLNCSAIRRPTLVSVPATAAIGRALSEATDYSPAPHHRCHRELIS